MRLDWVSQRREKSKLKSDMPRYTVYKYCTPHLTSQMSCLGFAFLCLTNTLCSKFVTWHFSSDGKNMLLLKLFGVFPIAVPTTSWHCSRVCVQLQVILKYMCKCPRSVHAQSAPAGLAWASGSWSPHAGASARRATTFRAGI